MHFSFFKLVSRIVVYSLKANIEYKLSLFKNAIINFNLDFKCHLLYLCRMLLKSIK